MAVEAAHLTNCSRSAVRRFEIGIAGGWGGESRGLREGRAEAQACADSTVAPGYVPRSAREYVRSGSIAGPTLTQRTTGNRQTATPAVVRARPRAGGGGWALAKPRGKSWGGTRAALHNRLISADCMGALARQSRLHKAYLHPSPAICYREEHY